MQQGTLQVVLRRCRCSLARMVGLNCAGGYQPVRTALNGIANQEFKLAGLVSTSF